MPNKIIYSTLTASQRYPLWDTKTNDLPRITKDVFIAGGANLTNKHIMTPKGMATPVSDEEYALLEKNPAFKRHVARGYLKVEDGKAENTVEKAVSDMQARDESAPLEAGDFEAEGQKPPSVGEEVPTGDDPVFQNNVASAKPAPKPKTRRRVVN